MPFFAFLVADFDGCLGLGVQSAQRELALWFNADELVNYDKVIHPWLYE